MKKVRTILVVLSAIYIALTIIFLLNDESLFNTFNLLTLIDYLQAWMVVGLVLLAATIIVGTLYIRSLKSRYNKLEKEHDKVKGRVFEIEEERKAELARQKAEEEETERKLEAFNSSLKGRDRRNVPSVDVDPEEDRSAPGRGEIDLGRLDGDSGDTPRPLPPRRPYDGSDDKV